MSTLYVGEKTNQGMLPQSLALESTSADKPGVGSKRGVETRPQGRVAGVRHGRGETGDGVSDPLQRHHSGAASAVPAGPVRDAVPTTAPRVFVLDRHGRPLMPCSPARARRLLKSGRARVHHLAPFVIRLVDHVVADSVVTGVEIKIDPGSKFTGVAVAATTPDGIVGLFSFEVQHHGQLISKKLEQRAGYRRGRRSRNLPYRAPRFNNRAKPKGWLGPSLRHRVDSTVSLVSRIRRWAPVTGIAQELVRFDMAKTHSLDALCVGDVTGVVSYPNRVIVAKATGRGVYARTRPNSSGFPRLRLTRIKAVYGFQTGDLVRANIPTGKYIGTHVGRVAVRTSGSFNISTTSGLVQSVSHRHCTVLQRSDGWGWSSQPEGVLNAA